MEGHPPLSKSPRYPRPLTVGKCHLQTAEDRFGANVKEVLAARDALYVHPEAAYTEGFDDEDDGFMFRRGTLKKEVPHMQRFRNNLTALSQVHNLYFVAYLGRIFVYRPRSVPGQILPSQPDLQLNPTQTRASRTIPGVIDRRLPHTINNIITGFLGNEEIVLACFDDGDVLAFYVNEIAYEVDHPTSTHCDPKHGPASQRPRPFFQDNVCISAWGLAIHQKSRLIVVSSNRSEVTVFAPAISESFEPTARSHGAQARQRTHDWRILVAMGHGASNLPNITLIDDEDGNAEKVCAIDINGLVWIADIWQTCTNPILINPVRHPALRSAENWPSPSRGWGILVLPNSSFIQVKTREELFGLPPDLVDVMHRQTRDFRLYVNVSEALKRIPGNTREGDEGNNTNNARTDIDETGIDETGIGEGGQDQQADSDDQDGQDDDESDSEDSDEVISEATSEASISLNVGGASPHGVWSSAMSHIQSTVLMPTTGTIWYNGPLPANADLLLSAFSLNDWTEIDEADHSTSSDSMDDDGSDESPDESISGQLGQILLAHEGGVFEMPEPGPPLVQFLRKLPTVNTRTTLNERDCDMSRFANKLCILRTYEKDIELRGFWQLGKGGKTEVGVMCTDALPFKRFANPSLNIHFQATSRLNMIAHAPELGLVAIGSATGQVVLLTLTRMAVPRERREGIWNHGFRVERILPDAQDDIALKLKDDHRPLHGMAMGPIQGEAGSAFPRTYRLILHYRNHCILSYEISRQEDTGKLTIF